MIIDKVQPYWTEEEREEHAQILKEVEKPIRLGGDYTKGNAVLQAKIKRRQDATAIERAVEDRYIKDRKIKGLLEDVEEIVNAITKEDFLARMEAQENQLAILRKEGTPEEDLTILKEYSIPNFDNCYHYILYYLKAQLNGLASNEEGNRKALSIVEKRVALWYVKPQPTHLPIPYSKPTDALAFMSQRRASIDAISGDATIDRFSVQVTIAKFKEMKANLGISTDKLLSTALGVFAKENDFSRGRKTATKRQVIIPLREYAKLAGYDVEEHETSTPEEAEAEKKRAKHALDNARKKIQKDLNILYNISFDWEEIINNKRERFIRVRLLSNAIYSRGDIAITFTPEIADHLVSRNLITQYNTGMLKLDERKPNAYYIMRKLEEHYNMDANQQNNRHDRIGIDTILAVTDLPSYEEVMKQDRHWIRRIKEPLEESLDYLTHEKLLKSWEYTHAKGVPLTDEEASNITSYSDFASLYLLFTPADQIDHTERQEKRKAEREKRRKRRNKKQSMKRD